MCGAGGPLILTSKHLFWNFTGLNPRPPVFYPVQVLPAFGLLFLVWYGTVFSINLWLFGLFLNVRCLLAIKTWLKKKIKKSCSQTKEHSHSSGSEASVRTYKIMY